MTRIVLFTEEIEMLLCSDKGKPCFTLCRIQTSICQNGNSAARKPVDERR